MARKPFYSIRMRSAKDSTHISGAAGIHLLKDVSKVVKQYTDRALEHERGRSDTIRITVEELKKSPKRIATLPLSTVNTRTPEAAQKTATGLLTAVGISERAVEEAFASLRSGYTMRGAMLLDIEGVRLEPDLLRGVRVSRMGIAQDAAADLSKRLGRLQLNNNTVKEALVLASKVHKFKMVLGELCISDDPKYTTGYIATRTHGYVRLPRIKKRGFPNGGRAFFITGGDIMNLIKYLQETPVLINSITPCQGNITVKELLERKSRR